MEIHRSIPHNAFPKGGIENTVGLRQASLEAHQRSGPTVREEPPGKARAQERRCFAFFLRWRDRMLLVYEGEKR